MISLIGGSSLRAYHSPTFVGAGTSGGSTFTIVHGLNTTNPVKVVITLEDIGGAPCFDYFDTPSHGNSGYLIEIVDANTLFIYTFFTFGYNNLKCHVYAQ
jgi:hypothetical protein